jgi:hypothetical protein
VPQVIKRGFVVFMVNDEKGEKAQVLSGWVEFITGKLVMLDAFERSKIQITNRPTQTGKGPVAEAEFRQWLRQFLPKKYSVTSGYIISQRDAFTSRNKLKNKLLEYDVIIYDELNSPLLWVESNSDSSEQGKKRAIPAEYVCGVLEVKSTFNKQNISDAFNKLNQLAPLLAGIDDENEHYKRYIRKDFCMGIVFFEYLKKEQEELHQLLLNALVPINFQRGLLGGIILQAEGIDRTATGNFQYFVENESSQYGGIAPNGWSNSREVESGKHLSCLLHWTQSSFAQFAFDLIAVMNGTYQSNRASSLHGLSFMLPPETE